MSSCFRPSTKAFDSFGMAILVVKFPKILSKLDKIFGQKSTYSKAGNYCIFSIDVLSCQKVQISDFKDSTYVNCWLNNIMLGAHFSSVFNTLYFSQWCPIFDDSTLLSMPQWWVEFDDELSWLFTNRFGAFYLICRKYPNPSQNFLYSNSLNFHVSGSTESVSEQPTQLIIVAEIRHKSLFSK